MPDLFIHPDRKLPKLKPFEAMRRMKRLIDDKEDTEQVFHIIEALNGPNAYRLLKKFAATQKGRAQLRERTSLPPMLDDHDTILKLPEGTVGRAYVDFMRREGLSAAGLVAESEKFARGMAQYDDDLRWFMYRLRDSHDLFHVLTGYGRDALGEASLLAFSYGQNGGRGVIFIAYVGSRHLTSRLPREIKVMEAFHEGRRHGKLAGKIIEEDISTLLHEPLDKARARLNIQRPAQYRRALVKISEMGDAHALLAAV